MKPVGLVSTSSCPFIKLVDLGLQVHEQ